MNTIQTIRTTLDEALAQSHVVAALSLTQDQMDHAKLLIGGLQTLQTQLDAHEKELEALQAELWTAYQALQSVANQEGGMAMLLKRQQGLMDILVEKMAAERDKAADGPQSPGEAT